MKLGRRKWSTWAASVLACLMLAYYSRFTIIKAVVYLRMSRCPEVILHETDLQTMLKGVHPVHAHPSVKLNASEFSVHSAPVLGYIMNAQERSQLIQLLADFAALFSEVGIEFVMVHGLLVGSYVRHGLLPWDDDGDIIVPYKDLPKVKRLFRDPHIWRRYRLHTFHEKHENEYALENLQQFPENASDDVLYRISYTDTKLISSQHKFKFYYSSSVKAGEQEWRWPFIDVAYYKYDNDVLWTLDKPPVTVPLDTFYPITLRPLESIWFPTPRSSEYFLKTKYGEFFCIAHGWDHRNEEKKFKEGSCCRDLVPYYSFVWRVPYKNDQTLEILIRNGTVHQAIVFPVPFKSKHFGF